MFTLTPYQTFMNELETLWKEPTNMVDNMVGMTRVIREYTGLGLKEGFAEARLIRTLHPWDKVVARFPAPTPELTEEELKAQRLERQLQLVAYELYKEDWKTSALSLDDCLKLFQRLHPQYLREAKYIYETIQRYAPMFGLYGPATA